jgi:hypothetical protein
MLGQKLSKRAGQVLLLLAIGATACQQNQPPQPPAPPDPAPNGTQSREGAFWVSGWGYCLRPIKSGPVEKSQEVWNDLFPKMARDAKTRELLTQLHGGWPTELVVVDAKQAEDKTAFKAPPPEGVAVVLRVADLQLKDVKTKAARCRSAKSPLAT